MSDPSTPPPDSYISTAGSLTYWNSVTPDVSGMLGGYPQVSRIDLQGSRNFLSKVRRLKTSSSPSPSSPATTITISTKSTIPTAPPSPPVPLTHVVDCGAGIGRVTMGFLSQIANKVSIVEPVAKFADVLAASPLKASGQIDQIYICGLESWAPPPGTKYDLIWNQWCLGHLTDAQLTSYLARCATVLTEGGWVVVKENLSTEAFGEDIYDDLDSSVTRSDASFKRLFQEAGLVIVRMELQTGFPKGLGLFPVKMYALRPT